MQGILDDMAVACPGARIFNYTNPVNIVAQAVTDHTDVAVRVAVRGPDHLRGRDRGVGGARPGAARRRERRPQPRLLERAPHLRRRGPDRRCSSEAWERAARTIRRSTARRAAMLRLAAAMGAIPASYFQYYYFEDEVLDELTAKPTTRAEDILGWVPGYWEHYARAGAAATRPSSTGPLARRDRRARAGDRLHGRRLQRPRRDAAGQRPQPRGSMPGFADTLVVETLGRCDADGHPAAADAARCRRTCAGSSRRSAEYQQAAADAAWSGDARDAVRALAAHPLVRSLDAGRAALRGDGRGAPRAPARRGSRPEAGSPARHREGAVLGRA